MGTRFTSTSAITSSGTLTVSDPSTTYVYYTPGGTEVKFEEKVGIAPKLYFKFVKSKLTEIETKKLKSRLKHLKGLLDGTKECGQDGLAEELEKQIAIIVREQEIAVCGFTKYCTKADIEKFKSRVKDHTIDLTTLEKFPRAIPKKIQTVIKAVKKRGLFDELWVLFNNPQREEAKKTTKEKIHDKIQKEKDPILWGKFSFQPDRYYFLGDWIDEFCDINLEKFISALSGEKVGEEYGLEKLPEIDEAEVLKIKQTVINRYKELKLASWEREKEEKKIREEEQRELERLRSRLNRPLWKKVLGLGLKPKK